MRTCMVCGVPTDGRATCKFCAGKLVRDRCRLSRVYETAYELAGIVKPRKRTRPPKPPQAVAPVCDEDECVEIDTRRFRNVEQGDA